ncbi:membrane protein [Lentibacillus kapialis]|uniref:Membrane protein n=1 Tax=Lentibacillus kapialis TaxID=340214 RepID=A0A917Q1M5_9BACI|nr:O-antigen ligase family protein [Lentibacillus kapialis]GGK05758.1 membrane protein [Lentibacillus kapialis]
MKQLTCTIAFSSIVFIEPAPYDVLLTGSVVIAILGGYTAYTTIHFWPVMMMLLFLETNIVSLYFIKEVSSASYFLIITVYCIVTWSGLIGVLAYFGSRILPLLFRSYVVAGLLVTIPGVVAYFSHLPMLDMLLWNNERVKGLFMDPNVFGPFLIPGALYALRNIGKTRQSKKLLYSWLGIFLLFSIGILLSFSRAAWGHFILALGIYFLLNNERPIRRFKTLFILTVVLIPVLIYMVMATDVGDLFFARTSLQGYDETRFEQQGESLDYMMTYPLGFGPGQSEQFLSQSTHSLFVRILSENGLFGIVLFAGFFLITLSRSIYMGKVSSSNKGYFVIVTSCLIGIAFNSLFIDTLHWRHFWLLLALPWMKVER